MGGLKHVRAQVLIPIAVLLILSGSTLAAPGLFPQITGDSRVVSNRVVVTAPPYINWFAGGPAGPTILEISGFGQIFVARCTNSVNNPPSGQPGPVDAVAVVFRNTSDVEIDAPGFTVVDPSIPV